VKTTNKYQIKSPSVVDALTADDYALVNPPANVFSCTTVIGAPKPYFLKRRHDKELERDVSDNFWMFDGSAVHYALEMSNMQPSTERKSEERMFIEVPMHEGRQIPDWKCYLAVAEPGETRIDVAKQEWYDKDKFYLSMQYDCFEIAEKCLEDYKRTQPWEIVYGLKPERECQLNIGAFGLRLLGHEVNKLRVCFFLKNWDKFQAGKGDYPVIPYAEMYPNVWPNTMCEKYIIDRMKLFIACSKASDNDIPDCTFEERWASETEYALMKSTAGKWNKKSSKNFKKFEMDNGFADRFQKEQETKYPASTFRIEERLGIDKRCADYCVAKRFCTYYNKTHIEVGQSGY